MPGNEPSREKKEREKLKANVRYGEDPAYHEVD